MIKKNSKLNRLIALAVLMGEVTCSNSVWATPPASPENTVFIYASANSEFNGTYPTQPDGAQSTDLGGNGIGIKSGNWYNAIDKIVTWDGSSAGAVINSAAGVFGIRVEGSDSVTATSISGGIYVGSSSGDVHGIKLTSSNSSTISSLGDIVVKATGGATAHGIYVENGTNTITFKDNVRSITIDKADNFAKYGIYLKGGTNNIGAVASGATGKLGSIMVGGIGDGPAYGIVTSGGDNTIALAGSGSSITATTSSNVYGIGFLKKNMMGGGILEATGTTKISGLGKITAISTGSGNVYGIYAKNGNSPTEETKKFTVEFVNNTIAADGHISVYSASGENFGIVFDENTSGSTGKSEVLNVKTIMAGVDPSDSTTITSGNVYGIQAKAGVNTVTFSGGTDSSITVKSNGTDVKTYGIYLEKGTNYIGTDSNNIAGVGLGSIMAEATGTGDDFAAYGIDVYDGNNTVKFAGTGSSITAKGNGDSVGILLAAGNTTITGLSSITAVSNVAAGTKTVYGILVFVGNNEITFTGAGSSIKTNINSGDSCGISFGFTGTAATGTTKITGLGSIVSDPLSDDKKANGIYVNNGNTAPTSPTDPATFSVTFATNSAKTTGGNINVYSESGSSCGILFEDDSTGKSEISNINAIVAGVDPSDLVNNLNDSTKWTSGSAIGISIKKGVNTVSFAGANKSIIVKSNNTDSHGIDLLGGTNYIGTLGYELNSIEVVGKGDNWGIYREGTNTSSVAFSGKDSYITVKSDGNLAIGIYLTEDGNTTVSGIGKITANGTGSAQAYGIYAGDGTNEISFKGNGGQAITATAGAGSTAHSISVSGGSTTVNFENSILSGKIAQSGGTLILNFNNGGAWSPVSNDVTGTMTVNVNSGGKIVFDLPSSITAGDTVLQMNGTVAIKDGSKIQVINDKATSLQEGDEICLIENDSNITLGSNVVKQHSSDGIAWSDADIYLNDTNNKKLMYKKTKMALDPNGSKAPVEGPAAASATINNSVDLAVDAGMGSLLTSTAGVDNTETFAASNFGKAKYKTGSHVDASGYGIVIGAGKKVFDKNGNKTTGGIFFEYGNSNFDTYNGNVTGDGKSIYKGGGYMMCWDNKSGNYYEGMVHAGRVKTNWSQNGYSNAYEIDPTYFGGAATYGHKFMLGEEKQLSVYGSYIYTHTGGADAMVGTYDYSFDSTNSHRTKVGVRYAMSDLMDTKKFRPYVGLAWEHEFDGESGAAVKGFGRVKSPSMKGDTGILEIGCKQEVGKWTLGIGVETFIGKRKGWNGTLEATYNF